MSKYCKPMELYVTYLDCQECEEKECRGVKHIHLALEPKQEVYLIYQSKREHNKPNIIVLCSVKECIVRSNETLYVLETKQVLTKNKPPKGKFFNCKGANINTGYRDVQIDCFPVFTSKERALEWLHK